jgi:hypothetical protein
MLLFASVARKGRGGRGGGAWGKQTYHRNKNLSQQKKVDDRKKEKN